MEYICEHVLQSTMGRLDSSVEYIVQNLWRIAYCSLPVVAAVASSFFMKDTIPNVIRGLRCLLLLSCDWPTELLEDCGVYYY